MTILIGGVIVNQRGVWEGTLLWSWQPSRRNVQYNFSAHRVRREAAEWLDKGSWPVVCAGLYFTNTEATASS